MKSDEPQRLSKIMAHQGLCSRREADELIRRGWVKVDGQTISELGTKVLPKVQIQLSPQALRHLGQKATILLNKPMGYVCTPSDDRYPVIQSLIHRKRQDPKDPQKFDPRHLKGLAAAGRLDIDSKGLVLLTQDGTIAKKIIGAHSQVPKEYLVRVSGRLPPEKLELLRHGLRLDDKALKPAQVDWINNDQLRFVLKEGRKRQIRRMCELVGLQVTGLKRVRIGQIRLHQLKEGQWRYLQPHEKLL